MSRPDARRAPGASGARCDLSASRRTDRPAVYADTGDGSPEAPAGELDPATRRRFVEIVFNAAHADDTILISTISEIARRGFDSADIRAVCAEPPPSTWDAGERLSVLLDQVDADHHRHSARFIDDIGELLAATDHTDPNALAAAATRIAQGRADDLEETSP